MSAAAKFRRIAALKKIKEQEKIAAQASEPKAKPEQHLESGSDASSLPVKEQVSNSHHTTLTSESPHDLHVSSRAPRLNSIPQVQEVARDLPVINCVSDTQDDGSVDFDLEARL